MVIEAVLSFSPRLIGLKLQESIYDSRELLDNTV